MRHPPPNPLSARPSMAGMVASFACAVVLATSAVVAPAVAGPIAVQADATFKVREGKDVRAVVFRFPAPAVRLQILPTLGLVATGRYQRPGLSIEDAVKVEALGKLSTGDMLIANGGFSGAKVERPIGLVISGGNAISLPDYSVQRGDPASTCPALRQDRPRRSGVLCADKRGRILVQHLDTVDFESCTDAVQAGPLLVEAPGRNGICESPPGESAYLRTALCTRDNDVTLVVTRDPVPLFDLAQWLAAPTSQGGLACEAALNLSGDSSSGAQLRQGHARAPWRKYGDGSFPLPNLIVITERPAPQAGARSAAPARVLVPQQTRRLAP